MRLKLIICIMLVIVTLGLYGQAVTFDFVSFDDGVFVTNNPMVNRGLTIQGVVWAFGLEQPAAYCPVAMISHMLDCTLFGAQDAAGHHAVNVALHTANVVLLFLLLLRLTGVMWPSTAVALLFAVHPLHVESVAWIAERRDVLCMFFCLLSLLSYERYARAPSVGRYVLVAVWLTLALLSKPLAVTLPCIMLLLDYWPLKRVSPWRRLVLEKLPLLALCATSSVLAMVSQQQLGATYSSSQHTLAFRLQNAVLSYGVYLRKLVWPADLGAHYPYPTAWPTAGVVASGAIIVVITALAARAARRRPYLIVGWLWYLGAMLPMAGLVSVGNMSMADRYTYLPMIGVYVMIVWFIADAGLSRRAMIAMAAIVFGLLAPLCWRQIGVWRNSAALYQRAIAVAPDSAWMHHNYGVLLISQGNDSKAISHLRRAIEIQPAHALALAVLGNVYTRTGQLMLADDHLQRALVVEPRDALAHFSMGNLRRLQRRYNEAVAHYQMALEADSNYQDARNNLGVLLNMVGRHAEAVEHLRVSLKHNRDNARLAGVLGSSLNALGEHEEAIVHLQRAVRLSPTHWEALADLAVAYAGLGQLDRAINTATKALPMAPPEAQAVIASDLQRYRGSK